MGIGRNFFIVQDKAFMTAMNQPRSFKLLSPHFFIFYCYVHSYQAVPGAASNATDAMPNHL